MDTTADQEIVLNISASHQSQTSSVKAKAVSLWTRLKRIGTVSGKDILLFFELLKTLNNAGLPINESLELLQQQTRNPKLKHTISQVREDIKSGVSFSQSLRKHPALFDESTCAVIRAGEKSGKLNDILKELTLQMQRVQAIRNQTISMLTYPIIVVSVMMLLVAVLLIFVVPKLESIFDGAQNLPFPTRVLIFSSDFLVHRWFLVLLALIFGFVGIRMLQKTHRGKRFFHGLYLAIPITNRITKKVIIARFTRLFGLLLNAGVPIVDSLKLSSNVAGNIIYKEKLLLAAEDISRGIPLAENLSDNERLFPPILVQMIAIGERTASLDTVIERVARIYDEELDREIKALSKISEPLILLVIASAAVFMIMAIYLPILQMNNHLM